MGGHRSLVVPVLVAAAGAVSMGFPASSLTGTRSAAVVVEQTRIIYEPDQVGGHFHEVFALVRNKTGSWKRVTGQFSIRQAGRLVGTPDADYITLAPRAEGLLQANAVKLPRPVPSGRVTLTVDASAPFSQPRSGAIRLQTPRYVKGGGGFGSCSLTVKATNTTSKKIDLAKISMVGLRLGRIVTGGLTYPTLYPHTPNIVEISLASPALCPARVDSARAYWSLGTVIKASRSKSPLHVSSCCPCKQRKRLQPCGGDKVADGPLPSECSSFAP